MQYLGGKSRIANWVASVIKAHWQLGMDYYEPFVGAGSVLVAVSKALPDATLHASDNHPDLILMWQALQQGWKPPTELDEAAYKQLKRQAPSPLRGFAGFGCAYGGDWFHGYARNTRKDRYAEQSAHSLDAKIRYAQRASFTCCDYRDLCPLPGSLIYCDPPYENTARYHCNFDHAEFWRTVANWSQFGLTVLVSSYKAPQGFKEIAALNRCQELRTNGVTRLPVVDKIFQYDRNRNH